MFLAAISACGFGDLGSQNSSSYCFANESLDFNWTSLTLQCFGQQQPDKIYRLIQTNPDPPDKAYTSMDVMYS